MHEITLIYGIADVVEKAEKANGLDHIEAVVVEVGELSGVVCEFLEEYYPMFAAELPPLNGSELIINKIPSIGKCLECETEFDIVKNEGVCPSCGSREKNVLTGTDFFIKEIHV